MTTRRSASASRCLLGLWLSLLVGPVALARGVSPYLPLDLEPGLDMQIERVLILADKPAMKRPFAAATVLDALPKACEVDAALCRQVRRYLDRYMESRGVTALGVTGAFADADQDGKARPNAHGQLMEEAWALDGRIYWQAGDHFLISAGGLLHEEDFNPTGSMLSVGFEYLQVDIGYRDHWLSPLTDASMLIGTQAPTMLSVTASNYTPLTRLGLSYEFFLAEMSRSSRIAYQGQDVAGRPRLAGMHLSLEPVSGWSIGANRLMQFGGGPRGGSSPGDIFDAFWSPSTFDNAYGDLSLDESFGNQVASFTSRFIFPGRTPFSVYFEYAGEDTSKANDVRLGNSALLGGIQFPNLFGRFDVTYEFGDWQNGWYVNGIYQDGLVNDGFVLGHWAGQERADATGAQSHMLRVGWTADSGQTVQLRYRTVDNEQYFGAATTRAHDFTLTYAQPWQQFKVGGELQAGRDVFDGDYYRIAGFVRLGDGVLRGGASGAGDVPAAAGAEWFVDLGAASSRVGIDLGDGSDRSTTDAGTALHLGIGARRQVARRHDLGVRLEHDDVDGHSLLAVRALDYRYRAGDHLAFTGFLGAARYSLATAAYGYWLGGGVQWRDLLPAWDVTLEARYGDKVARDKLLPTDAAAEPRPDSFYDIYGLALSLSRRW